MRVFVGLWEVAGFTSTYAKGFRQLGHETYTAVVCRNRYYPDCEYDEILTDRIRVPSSTSGLWRRSFALVQAWVALLSVFLKAMLTCDTFLFIYGSSFLPQWFDYRLLKLCRKRLISVFVGSDIRYWYSYQKEMRSRGLERELGPRFGLRASNDLYDVKLRTVRAAEKFADLISSGPVYGQLQVRRYIYADLPLDLTKYRFHVPERRVPVIVHAPTDRGLKGTEFVLAAVKTLEKEGIRFEFNLLENVPNDKLLLRLADADIVVDQLFGHMLGTLAMESLASGNVVLSRYDEGYAPIGTDCPVVNTNMFTLVDHLRKVISDRTLRRKLAYAGRAYVEKHNSHVQVVQRMIDLLKSNNIKECDYVPTFFQTSLVIPKALLEKERATRKRQLGGFGQRVARWLLWPFHFENSNL